MGFNKIITTIRPYIRWNLIAPIVLTLVLSLFGFYQSCSRARFANIGGFAFGVPNVTITGFPGGETTGGDTTGGDTTGGDTTGGDTTGGDTTGGDTTGGDTTGGDTTGGDTTGGDTTGGDTTGGDTTGGDTTGGDTTGGDTTGGDTTGGDTTGGDTTGGDTTGGDTTGGDTTGGDTTGGDDNYVCGDNLIRNPSFEIVDGRLGLAAGVALNELGQNGKPSSDVYQSLPDEANQTSWFTESGAGIEVKRNSTVTAYHGEHYIELDTQPVQGSSITNSKMSQVFRVPKTAHYKLTYRFRAQSVDPGDNYVTSDVQPVSSKTVKSQNTPNWRQVVQVLKLNAGSHKISFDAAGTENSAGGFVDDVQLIENCE